MARMSPETPASLEGCLEGGGFGGLMRAERLSPLEIVILLREARLRGRGPGAEPCFLKWWRLLQDEGRPSLVVDARELDPRSDCAASLLERNPHGLIEALAIAALALGSGRAYYRPAPHLERFLPSLQAALSEAGARGLLEVCSLAISPYPADGPKGPFLSHSLETWYHVSLAASLGPAWYTAYGAAGQSGTRLLTVGGDVAEPGLVEVPWGAPLWQALEEAGGIQDIASLRMLCLDDGLSGFLNLERAATPLAPEELLAVGVNPAAATLWAMGQEADPLAALRRAVARSLELEDDPQALKLGKEAMALVDDGAGLAELKEIAVRLRRARAFTAWPLHSFVMNFPQHCQA